MHYFLLPHTDSVHDNITNITGLWGREIRVNQPSQRYSKIPTDQWHLVTLAVWITVTAIILAFFSSPLSFILFFLFQTPVPTKTNHKLHIL